MALGVTNALTTLLYKEDTQMRLSLTYYQGRKIAANHRLTQVTGMQIYFANQLSLWNCVINKIRIVVKNFLFGLIFSNFTKK